MKEARCADHVRGACMFPDILGIQPNFQAFLGSFWDTVCKLRPRRVRDVARFSGISREFLGDGVQAMDRTLLGDGTDTARLSGIFGKFLGTEVFGTRCVGHVKDATGTHPDFQAVCGHRVQAMFEMYPGLDWDADWLLGISWQFLGLSVQAMFGTPHGHSRDPSWPRARSGSVVAVVGTQLDFQAFVGSLWAWCAGHVRDASWPWQGHSLIFRHFLTVSWTWSYIQDAIGTHPDFHVFLGNFFDLVCKQFLGRVGAAVGMQPDFKAFLGSFLDKECRLCLGRDRDATLFSGISRQFQGHNV
ncbi:Hypothetical predicted protein [Olea europaea subsp. europaea]|uniref:Uncharacterized protein n=1 Tax=Olea europaea subsp. europaea TaxID=158383 RepID=A0A8S0PRM6_OLEEU|nr:Hypothetical predicted protein [Olea europaea subsp. europaea]